MVNDEKITTTEKKNSAKSMMLWIGMGSIVMTFAGLTSAYIVSSKRADWLSEVILPPSFALSTFIIVLSSLSLYLAQKNLAARHLLRAKIFFISTLLLSILFGVFQFKGFEEIIQQGYYFTGPASNIAYSYIYLLVLLHLVHLFAGVLLLLRVNYLVLINPEYYQQDNKIGLKLVANFWHFLGFIWLYLYCFFQLV